MKKKIAYILLGLFFSVLLFPTFSKEWQENITKENTSEILKRPSFSHFLGTDNKGRDILYRSFYGASLSLWMAFSINLLGIVLGSLFGLFLYKVFSSAGFWVVENLLAIPFFVLGGIFSVLIGTSLSSLILSFGLLFALPYAYMIQSYIESLHHSFFLKRSKQVGRSYFYIAKVHIFPFVRGKLYYQFWISLHSTIFALASMTFLGFGIKPPYPEWGSLIYASLPYFKEQPFFMITPFALFLSLAWAINTITTPKKPIDPPFNYPSLSIIPFSFQRIIASIRSLPQFQKSLYIKNEPSDFFTFPKDYHHNFPTNFPLKVFLKDLFGKEKLEDFMPSINTLLEELELPLDVLCKTPGELSGGMLQRLTIILAKLMKDKALIIESPFSSLNDTLKTKALNTLLSSPLQTIVVTSPYADTPKTDHPLLSPLWFYEGHYTHEKELPLSPLKRSFIEVGKDPILEVKNPKTFYPTPLLENQTLMLYPSEIVGLVGYSGIGKTTLGKMIVGFLPLQKGERTVQKNDLRTDMILQDPQQFNEYMKVKDVLTEFNVSTHPKLKINKEDMLGKLGLPTSLLFKTMGELSKDEQYQVLLLRSFIYKPHLLILDELFDHIEVSQYPLIFSLLEELIKDSSKTCIVIISHKEPLLSQMADRIITLKEQDS